MGHQVPGKNVVPVNFASSRFGSTVSLYSETYIYTGVQGRKTINPSGGYPADIQRMSEWWRGCQKGPRTFTNQLINSTLLNLLNGKRENQQNA